MLRATRSFTAIYDGEPVEITEGMTSIDASCDLARDYPADFEPEARLERNGRVRSRLSLEDETRVRAERIAEVTAREQQRRAKPDDAADRAFWSGVQTLLDSDPRRAREAAEDREGVKLMNEFDAARADAARADMEDLASWLDR